MIPGLDPDPEQAREWINLNAFTAQLVATRLMSDAWLTFGILRMREAFEERGHTELATDCNVLIANMWIWHAGKVLYRFLSRAGSDDDDGMFMHSPGPLFNGRSTSGLDRWNFWKARAVEIRHAVSEDVQSVALRITKRMVAIEEGQVMI